MLSLKKTLSRLPQLPLLSPLSPARNRVASAEEKAGFLKSQSLAMTAAKEVASHIKPGWTEKQAAALLHTFLRDHGVRAFFHDSFAWFGERAGFSGISRYAQFMPSTRVLQENEGYILDVAPIVDGFVSDIGYTSSVGENLSVKKAGTFLATLKAELPNLFISGKSGAEIWKHIDRRITEAGYTNAYVKYPFSVVGHRVHRINSKASAVGLYRFGWQSFWSIASRGVLSQLLTDSFEGDLTGLWAIEPHLAGPGFGAKFEEILVVEPGKAYWLSKEEK